MAAAELSKGCSYSVAQTASVIAHLYSEQNKKVGIIAKLSNNVSDLSQNQYLQEVGLVLPRQRIQVLYANIPTHTSSIQELINALIKKNEALDEEIRLTKEFIAACDSKLIEDGVFS